MPVVFATGAPTASGHAYEDIYGVQYEFPDRYRNLVSEGDRFVYYRGRRATSSGGLAAYIGAGVVGAIRDSANSESFVAAVHDVSTFVEPVAIKDSSDRYLETGSTRMTNFANGVRRIDDLVFEHIVQLGDHDESSSKRGSGFADPVHARQMERYSVGVVMALLGDEFGAALVHEMAPGNPGFDIEVRTAPPLHVEVKGTVLTEPVFHLSEGQRQHAEALGPRFRLYVVYSIDRRAGKHEIEQCDGATLAQLSTLRPEAWTGLLSTV